MRTSSCFRFADAAHRFIASLGKTSTWKSPSWPRAFRLGDFPFLFVQLANYLPRTVEPGESEWAELREAQLKMLAEPNTGMAVPLDIGEANHIHPLNKKDVGRQLALLALACRYGHDVESSGPLFASATRERDRVWVHFHHARGVRTSDGGPPMRFSIAGADRRFVWAVAMIDGEDVVVRSPTVSASVAVRYGWTDNPQVNLVNGAGLPAPPFGTDDWAHSGGSPVWP